MWLLYGKFQYVLQLFQGQKGEQGPIGEVDEDTLRRLVAEIIREMLPGGKRFFQNLLIDFNIVLHLRYTSTQPLCDCYSN